MAAGKRLQRIARTLCIYITAQAAGCCTASTQQPTPSSSSVLPVIPMQEELIVIPAPNSPLGTLLMTRTQIHNLFVQYVLLAHKHAMQSPQIQPLNLRIEENYKSIVRLQQHLITQQQQLLNASRTSTPQKRDMQTQTEELLHSTPPTASIRSSSQNRRRQREEIRSSSPAIIMRPVSPVIRSALRGRNEMLHASSPRLSPLLFDNTAQEASESLLDDHAQTYACRTPSPLFDLDLQDDSKEEEEEELDNL